MAARTADEPRSRDALSALCEAYWYPIYVFVRRQGHGPDEALDLTQGFFLELLEKHLLNAVRKEAGKFRSFLLGTLKNYLAHTSRKERALKRGGPHRIVSLDAEDAERRYRLEPRDDHTPETVYEQRWAATVAALARGRLRREMEAEGKADLFRLLGGLLTGEAPEQPYREIARKLETTEASVKMAVRRLRQRFGRLLRDEIAQTVDDRQDVDGELRHLLTVARHA